MFDLQEQRLQHRALATNCTSQLFSDRDTNSVTPDSLYKAMNRFLKGQSVTMDDAEELIRESGVELADGCIPVQSFEKIVRQLNIKLKV